MPLSRSPFDVESGGEGLGEGLSEVEQVEETGCEGFLSEMGGVEDCETGLECAEVDARLAVLSEVGSCEAEVGGRYESCSN